MIKILEITSSKNKIIKEIKGLHKRKARWDSQLFIVEGIKIIEEAIRSKLDLKYIVYTEKLLEAEEAREFFDLIKDEKNLIKTTEAILKEISDTENPQGVLGLVSFEKRNLDQLFKEEGSFYLYLDELQDPGNMGTIIRSGDAFKLDGIIVGKGSVDPYNPKVVRSTMGSIFRVPLYFPQEDLEFLKRAKGEGFKLITSSLEGEDLGQLDLSSRSILVIGNEAKGAKKEIMDLSDLRTRIPMPGQAESLNAGVAASIIMYEAMKARNLEL